MEEDRKESHAGVRKCDCSESIREEKGCAGGEIEKAVVWKDLYRREGLKIPGNRCA